MADWVTRPGCTIAGADDAHGYLGAPLGTNMTAPAIQKFSLEKLCKRLTKLLPQTLSFAGKVQMVKQVLLVMPAFHLMYLWLLSRPFLRYQEPV